MVPLPTSPDDFPSTIPMSAGFLGVWRTVGSSWQELWGVRGPRLTACLPSPNCIAHPLQPAQHAQGAAAALGGLAACVAAEHWDLLTSRYSAVERRKEFGCRGNRCAEGEGRGKGAAPRAGEAAGCQRAASRDLAARGGVASSACAGHALSFCLHVLLPALSPASPGQWAGDGVRTCGGLR